MYKTYSIAILIALLWGVAPHIQKSLSKDFHPFEFLVLSGTFYAVTILLSVIFNFQKINTSSSNLNWKNIFAIFMFSFVFVFIPNLLFLVLLSNGNVKNTTALTYTSPLFMLIAGYLIFGNNIQLVHIAGIILLIAGALLLIK